MKTKSSTAAENTRRATSRGKTASPLMVRLDSKSKASLADAAALRGISVSDYVRAVLIPLAQREVAAASQRTIVLSPDEQLAFWNALHAPVRLTPAQRRLGRVMRGQS
jgi:uncharacterized protein (DUF1778 family)